MDLFDLFAKITLDTSEYEENLRNTSQSASSFGDKIKTAFGNAGKIAGLAIGAVATGTVALTSALISGTGKVAEYGDNIDKMSQKMGLSAQSYQEWDAILQHSGASIDSMQRGMTTLSKAVEDNSDAFSKLGISQKELANMNQEEIFARTIEGLQNMEAGTERNVLAQELLGGSAKELGALLNTTAEDTEAMRQRVHELNGVMSDESVKAAAAYQDSLQDMQTAFGGLKRNLFSEFMPAITTVMDGLTDIFSGNDDRGIGLISQGISNFAKKITESIPRILKVGTQIVTSLTTSIVQNLPQLVSAGASALIELANGLASNIDIIVDAAFEIIDGIVSTLLGPSGMSSLIDAGFHIIGKIASALVENLPSIIPAVLEIILQIYESLIDNIDVLVDAAISIILALADGLIRALPILLSKGPEIVGKLVSAIITNAPKLLSAGLELVVKLATGIANNFATILEKGRELVGKIGDGIKEKLSNLVQKGKDIVNSVKSGIQSVISQAVTWGKDLIQNFINGITAKFNALKDKVKSVASTVKKFLGFSVPEEGPLSDADTYMPDFMDLMAKGIRQYQGKVFNAAETLAEGIETHATPDFSMRGVSGYSTGSDSRILAALGIYFPELIDVIRNMKLYLDGRALVGGIIDYTDEGLGRISVHRERAN